MQKPIDNRRLSPDTQAVLRRRVVLAVRDGMDQSEAARTFHVSRQSVNTWFNKAEKHGLQSLEAKKRGRPASKGKLLPWQAATLVHLILSKGPNDLGMPWSLWTRQAVAVFIERRFGVKLTVWTVGRMLKRWKLTPQKPVRRAYEQQPEAVKKWLQEEYPRIVRLAKKEGANIHWGDQTGFRSDHQTGTTYGRRGETPVILGTGKRFGCSMLSTLTNKGELRFMLYDRTFTALLCIDFLKRLVRHCRRKPFVILDRHPVHRSKKLQKWLADNKERVRVFLLPGYAPELNPDELVNQDVKSNAIGRKRPMTLQELKRSIRSFMMRKQRDAGAVIDYFKKASVSYAA